MKEVFTPTHTSDLPSSNFVLLSLSNFTWPFSQLDKMRNSRKDYLINPFHIIYSTTNHILYYVTDFVFENCSHGEILGVEGKYAIFRKRFSAAKSNFRVNFNHFPVSILSFLKQRDLRLGIFNFGFNKIGF